MAFVSRYYIALNDPDAAYPDGKPYFWKLQLIQNDCGLNQYGDLTVAIKIKDWDMGWTQQGTQWLSNFSYLQTYRKSHCLAMANFTCEKCLYVHFMWWRVHEACSHSQENSQQSITHFQVQSHCYLQTVLMWWLAQQCHCTVI